MSSYRVSYRRPRDHCSRPRPHRRARPPRARGRLPDRDARRGRQGHRRRRRRLGLRTARRGPGAAAARPGRRSRRRPVLRPHRYQHRDLPHRPAARPGRGRRPGRHRLAVAYEPAVLPGQRRGPAGPGAPAPVRVRRGRADQLRGRIPRLRRRAPQRPAAEGDRAPAIRPDAGHRRDHPARPGRHRPCAARRVHLRAGRARHGQDRRRTAPGRLPPLHARRAAGPIRSARRRPQPGVPALHRAGAADPRRGGRRADDRGRADRAGAGPGRRPARGRRAQGRRPDGRGAPPGAVGRDHQAGRVDPGAADRPPLPHPGRAAQAVRRRPAPPRPRRRRPAGPDDDEQLRHSAPARERRAMLLAEDPRRQKEEAGGSPTDAETRRAARSPEVRAFCDEVGPGRDAAGLLFALWSNPRRLARAARNVLDDAEQALLLWPRAPRSVRTTPWTAADAVLVDEVAGLLERTPGYGHVVVDEAQDLSPMQCRAVGRRLAAGSLTVLGDLAQATSPWSPSDWQATLAGLGRPGTVVRPLTRGYRVPGEVLDYANRLLPLIAPDLPPASAVRSEPGSLRIRPVASLAGPLAEVVGDLAAVPGSIGVVCADDAVDEVVALLGAAGLPAAALSDDGEAAARVAVVPAALAKGLEFDAVVVVDPAAIVAAEPRGLHRLYVVLTRAVSTLAVLHRGDLPAPLAL